MSASGRPHAGIERGVRQVGEQTGRQHQHRGEELTVTTELMSFVLIESMNHSPMPCQPKIFSVKVAPVNMARKPYEKKVAIGISAIRRPCLSSARAPAQALGAAVRR